MAREREIERERERERDRERERERERDAVEVNFVKYIANQCHIRRGHSRT